MSRSSRPATRRLATPDVVSWPLFWISTAVLVSDDFRQLLTGVSTSAVPLESLATALLCTLASQMVAFGILLCARLTWLRPGWSRRHPMVTVWSFALAAIVAQSVVALAPMVQPTTGLDRMLIQAATFWVVALIVMAAREHRQAMADLTATQAALVASLAEGERRLDHQQNDVRHQVDAVIDEALRALAHPDAGLAAHLQRASEEALRPLSHALATDGATFEVTLPDTPKPRWRHVLTQVANQPLIAPLATALAMTALAIRQTIFATSTAQPQVAVDVGSTAVGVQVDLASFGYAVAGLSAVFTITYFSAWLVRRMTQPWLPNASPGRRWLIVVVSIIPIAVMTELGVLLLYSFPGPAVTPAFTPWAIVTLVIPIVAVTLVVAIVRTIGTAQSDVRSQIAGVNEELAWQVARINSRLLAERRRLSLAVHGPIRAVLTAGSIELERTATAPSSPANSGAIADETARRLTAARAALLEATQAPDVVATLEETRRLWRGVCRIDNTLTPAAEQRLRHDAEAREAVIAVTSEAIGNAISHARATRVEITIDCADRAALVTIRNDGRPPAPDAGHGLGTLLINELTTDWSLTSSGGWTTLRATIPMC